LSDTVYWDRSTVEAALRSIWKTGSEDSYTDELSGLIVDFLKCRSFFAFDSGRSAIGFSLRQFRKIHPDRRDVVLPWYVCSGVIEPILRNGLKPVFCGIERDLNISFKALKELIGPQTLAVIVPHTYGYPAQVDLCSEMVKSYSSEIFIIDDAAAAFGNKIGDKHIGTFGDIGILSFNQAKMVVASGGGGVLVNNRGLEAVFHEAYEEVPGLNAAQRVAQFVGFLWNYRFRRYSHFVNYGIYRIFGKSLSHSVSYGHRMSVIDAAMIIDQVGRFHAVHRKRSRIIRQYMDYLGCVDGITIPQPDSDFYHVGRFYLSLRAEAVLWGPRGEVVRDMPLSVSLRDKNIMTQYGYYPYCLLYGCSLDQRDLFYISSLIALPVNHRISFEQHLEVAELIKAHVVNGGKKRNTFKSISGERRLSIGNP